MEPYVAPPRDDGGLGVRADAVVGVRTLGPDAPLTSDDTSGRFHCHIKSKKATTEKVYNDAAHSRLRLYSYRREMDDLHAGLCVLPVELKALILSKIEHIEAHHVLALSSTFQEAFSLLRALPRTFDFEGVEGDLADHLVRVLDDARVRSLDKERALELIGDGNKGRLCEYACGRNFEVLRWAHNELHLPWAQYPAEPVSDDVLVLCMDLPWEPWGDWYPAEPVSDDILALRVLRAMWPKLQEKWSVAARPEDWHGVTIENGRVVELNLPNMRLGGAVPAEIGQLTSLEWLDLYGDELTSVPAEIGQLASLTVLRLFDNQLTRLPAEIGQLTSLRGFWLFDNRLTSVPAEIEQLRAAGCYVHLDAGVTIDE